MSQVINYHGLEISQEKIAEFCGYWKIIELAFFGSIPRDDFRPDSDRCPSDLCTQCFLEIL